METNPVRPADAAAAAQARALVRLARSGALATLEHGGAPLSTLTLTATDSDGTPVLLVSDLSAHTRNLRRDPRCSLLAATAGKGDPLAHPRVSAAADARFLERGGAQWARARRRFLAKHPKSALYADFGDFSFVALDITGAALNGGFGKAFELAGAQMRCATADAQELIDAEESALAHLNQDHRDALALYARVAGAAAGAWRATGLDPEGLDLGLGDKIARVAFPERVTDARGLRLTLKLLAERARAGA